MDALGQREKMEVLFALDYVRQFKHGTSGHLGYVVIAQLAEIADALWNNQGNDVLIPVDDLHARLAQMLQAPTVQS